MKKYLFGLFSALVMSFSFLSAEIIAEEFVPEELSDGEDNAIEVQRPDISEFEEEPEEVEIYRE